MARKIKILTDNEGLDRREVGYYSTPRFVADYLTQEMLAINPQGYGVLDPATGKEELLTSFYEANKHIDSFDIIDHGNHKFSNFQCKDFIDFFIERMSCIPMQCREYDYMIANPPYNCHEVSYIKDNKKRLNAAFPIGAYNMYSMFLSAMINIAKEGCLIGVIISDSFLTATLHAKLREQILKECSIHELILCPNDLFWSQNADVRTCILILQKGKRFQKNVLISNRPNNKEEFHAILDKKDFKSVPLQSILLGTNKSINQFIIDIDEDVVTLFKTLPSLGSLYRCVTCISTGNDKKYLSKEIKPGFTVPFYKNPAKRKFKTEPDAFLIDEYMEESERVKDFMVRNKAILKDEGIACSSMGLPFSAAYKPQNAVTGVNATIFPQKNDIYWLIAYLNSSLVTYFIRGVLIRSNMVTSGYVSKIPVLNLSEQVKHELDIIAKMAIRGDLSEKESIKMIDNIVFEQSGLSDDCKKNIYIFVNNLGKAV